MPSDPLHAHYTSMVEHLHMEMARAICRSEGVDPDRECHGMGRLIPKGEVWPAWKVRLPAVRAAWEVYLDSQDDHL